MFVFAASPSVSAPAEDCATAADLSTLSAGDPVYGLTVSEGTTPEDFTGTYRGVLKDGIAPGLDMILVELTSPEIDRVGGIWAGMSGSPVYADTAHTQLIGAVSYGLSTGPSKKAGVTPFGAMNRHLSARFAPQVKVTAKAAAGTYQQLPVPLVASGVSQRRLDQVAGKRTWLESGVRAAGASSSTTSSATDPDADTIVAGGNLGAAISWGDITYGGVGTATSVCNGKVVGFGHPLEFDGKTNEALLPASAIFIQEDPTLSPFKVANFGAPAGIITDDRLAGITGTFGPEPQAFSISDRLALGSDSRTGVTKIPIKGWIPDIALDQIFANHDSVLDDYTFAGSEARTWRITGKDASGAPFALSLRDRFSSDEDLSIEPAFVIADQLYALSSVKGVTLESLESDATATDDTTTYRVGRVQQYRAGAWHWITRTRPVYGHAGQVLNVRTELTSETGTRFLASKVTIPNSVRGVTGTYTIGGIVQSDDDEEFFDDEDYEEYPSSDSLPELLAYYRRQHSSDQLYGSLRAGGRTVAFKTAPADKIIYGSKTVPVRVALR